MCFHRAAAKTDIMASLGLEVSERLFSTSTKCFDAKNGPGPEEGLPDADVVDGTAVAAGTPKARKGHVTTTPVEPAAEDVAAYKEGMVPGGSPLRIVRHTVVHARERTHAHPRPATLPAAEPEVN